MLKTLSLLLLTLTLLQGKHLHKERAYQEHFCKGLGGISEYVLEDRTRVDCLCDEFAIEVDFASKWAESIGQSLYYAHKTNKKAAVLLIIEDEEKEIKYLQRLQSVSPKHAIDIWTINKNFHVQKASTYNME